MKQYNESQNKDNEKSGRLQYVNGNVHAEMGDYDAALKNFQLAFEAFKKAKGPNHSMTLHVQYRIACTYENLGRYHEAEAVHEIVYAEQQRVLSPNHIHIRWTKNRLDNLKSFSNYGSERSSLSTSRPSSIISQCRSLDDYDGFADLDTSQRRHSTAF